MSAKVDDRVLKKLFKRLIEDSDFVQFLDTIPGFCRSSVVRDPLIRVTKLGKEKICTGVKGLLERTWSSTSLSGPEKLWRLVVCVKFADAIRLSDVALSILRDIFPQDQHDVLQSIEMGQSLRRMGSRIQQDVGKEQEIGLCAQSIVAGIISNAQGSNEGWVALAADQLGKSEDVIRGYLRHGNDNVLLANLTHITRQIFHSLKDNRDMAASSSTIIPSLSKFDIRNTLPELQDSFRALWDEIEHAPIDELVMDIRNNLVNLHNSLSQAQGHNDVLTSTAPGPGHIAVDTAYNSSLGGIPEAMRRPSTVAAWSDPAPLGGQSRSGTSQAADYVATTATAGNDIANNPSREPPTVRSNLDSALPAMVTSLPSSTAPMAAASLNSPRVAGAAPLVAHQDPQDLSDPPVELASLNRTR
jgi:hypothetical protein